MFSNFLSDIRKSGIVRVIFQELIEIRSKLAHLFQGVILLLVMVDHLGIIGTW